jgi:glycogen phosphorylase
VPVDQNEEAKDDFEPHEPTAIKTKKKCKLKRKGSKFDLQGETSCPLLRPEFVYGENKERTDKIWELMKTYQGSDIKSIQRSIVNHVEYTLAMTRFNFSDLGCYMATATSLKDRLLESWNDSNQYFTTHNVKRVYYLSLEFLLGRLMQNTLINIDMEEQYRDALLDIGYRLEGLYDQEVDPALGNGGLGRLAACFLDSLATLEIPAWGYGIRYDYGIFKQEIRDGYQCEIPDFWLSGGNPWEIERPEVNYQIRFYGYTEKYDDDGVSRAEWKGGEVVLAKAYDTPIPGYNTFNCNNLRLWKSIPAKEFDFESFNKGDYDTAVEAKQRAEYITSVLYPNDNTNSGKELRLKQQYFFCSATIRDIIRRFKKINKDWKDFPNKAAIQLNDTHPAIAAIEFLRILIDEEKLPWEQSWKIMHDAFSYTNHTVLPEALESWSVGLLGHLLPRHLELIYMINHIFMEEVAKKYPGDYERMKLMSLIQEGDNKSVRMANLSILCSHRVNGVAALHTRLLKETIFKPFHEYFPNKIENKTNGVTPRRWIRCANPLLSELITETLGESEWLQDLDRIEDLENFVEDTDFIKKWKNVKKENKAKLAEHIKEKMGIDIPINALYDLQIKRIHEYKRQTMNILYVIYRYLTLKEMTAEEREQVVPRVIIFGGKAAPGYHNAKAIIKLINAVGDVVNNDEEIGDILKVIFYPNYCVSGAQILIPASELSQHISTAGMEASGTSNMKFIMNGCLIIGTMDGANVEISEEIGEDNMFIFGARIQEVDELRHLLFSGKKNNVGKRLQKVFDAIYSGMFGDVSIVHPIIESYTEGKDYYLVTADFNSYVKAQNKVDETYRNQKLWNKMSIMGVAKSFKFSSDRTIQEYCDSIWKAERVPIPTPSDHERVRSFSNIYSAAKKSEIDEN